MEQKLRGPLWKMRQAMNRQIRPNDVSVRAFLCDLIRTCKVVPEGDRFFSFLNHWSTPAGATVRCLLVNLWYFSHISFKLPIQI